MGSLHIKINSIHVHSTFAAIRQLSYFILKDAHFRKKKKCHQKYDANPYFLIEIFFSSVKLFKMHKFLVKVVSFSLQSKLGATSVCEFILHTVCLRGEGGG